MAKYWHKYGVDKTKSEAQLHEALVKNLFFARKEFVRYCQLFLSNQFPFVIIFSIRPIVYVVLHYLKCLNIHVLCKLVSRFLGRCLCVTLNLNPAVPFNLPRSRRTILYNVYLLFSSFILNAVLY